MAGEVLADALVERVERTDRLGSARPAGCLIDEGLDRGDLLGVVRSGEEVGDGWLWNRKGRVAGRGG